MCKLKLPLLSLATCMLLACGGGSSSSGGGNTDYNGVYNGTWNVKLSQVGSSNTQTTSVRIRVTINGSKVTINDSESTGTGSISGDSYRVPMSYNLQLDDVTSCEMAHIFSGTVGGGKTSGNVSGSVSCTGGVSFLIGGSFDATK